MNGPLLSVVAVGIGLFTIVSAMADWDWFFEHRKAKFFVDAFGRDGARIFYGALGCAIIFLGLYCR